MKELICKNCGHSETLEKINGSNVTKILIAPYPRERKKDALHIYPLYCLKCNYITEWATDSQIFQAMQLNILKLLKSIKNIKQCLFQLKTLLEQEDTQVPNGLNTQLVGL